MNAFGDVDAPTGPVQRFTVNSTASNVLVGVALLLALPLLCGAFGLFEQGDVLWGVAAAAGFLAILMPAGLVARRLGSVIEVSDGGIAKVERSGKRVEIRWEEPHELHQKTTVVRRFGLPMARVTKVSITARDRAIRFTVQGGGALGAAARLSKTEELTAGPDALARAIALSTAARQRLLQRTGATPS